MVRGRFAKMISFLVKHSSTVDGDETITTGIEPYLRYKTGPYFADNEVSVNNGLFFKR